jgi:hypothetical protein
MVPKLENNVRRKENNERIGTWLEVIRVCLTGRRAEGSLIDDVGQI